MIQAQAKLQHQGNEGDSALVRDATTGAMRTRDVFEYLCWKEKRLEEISILAFFEKRGKMFPWFGNLVGNDLIETFDKT